jgi:hypothetical protein
VPSDRHCDAVPDKKDHGPLDLNNNRLKTIVMVSSWKSNAQMRAFFV